MEIPLSSKKSHGKALVMSAVLVRPIFILTKGNIMFENLRVSKQHMGENTS